MWRRQKRAQPHSLECSAEHRARRSDDANSPAARNVVATKANSPTPWANCKTRAASQTIASSSKLPGSIFCEPSCSSIEASSAPYSAPPHWRWPLDQPRSTAGPIGERQLREARPSQPRRLGRIRRQHSATRRTPRCVAPNRI